MQNFFMAGSELVRWSLEVLETDGLYPLRLTVRHARGAIVEYFKSTETALLREQELEKLLMAARGGSPSMLIAVPRELEYHGMSSQ